MFFAHTSPTTGLTAQRYPQVFSLLAGLKQCGLGVGFFFHAQVSHLGVTSASLPKSMNGCTA
jgi:hypothetical protein